MTAFTSHRAAALALLNSGADLSAKQGGFLGQAAFLDALTEKQENWLRDLLRRHEQPPLAGEASRG